MSKGGRIINRLSLVTPSTWALLVSRLPLAATGTSILLGLRVVLAEGPKWVLCWPAPIFILWGLLTAALLLVDVLFRTLVARRSSWLGTIPSFGFALGVGLVFTALAPDFVGEAFTWAGDRPIQMLLALVAFSMLVVASVIVTRVDNWRVHWLLYVVSSLALIIAAGACSLITSQSFSLFRAGQLAYSIVGTAAWLGLVWQSQRTPDWRPARLSVLGGTFGVLAIGILGFHTWLHRPGPVPTDTSHPNVFLITVDTLRADVFERVQALQTLRSHGVTFRQAFAQAPWTQSSVVSLLTSRYPSEANFGRAMIVESTESHDFMFGPRLLNASLPTLTTLLSRDGYSTLAVLTNSILTPSYGFDAGFGRYAHASRGYTYRSLALVATVGAVHRLVDSGWLPSQATPMTEFALRELDHLHDGGSPIFMWLHYNDPHSPYSAPGAMLHFSKRYVDEFRHQPPPLETANAIRAAYEAEVRYTNQAIEHFLNELRVRGLYDASLIVFTSDHGEEFWEHGSVEHGHTLHNELVNVPLIVKMPAGVYASQRVESAVALVDTMPTILEVTGVSVPKSLRGHSLLGLLDGRWQLRPEPVFSEAVSKGNEQKALRSDDYTVIVTPSLRSRRVYNRRTDSSELHDISGKSGRWQELAVRLDKWSAEMIARAFENESTAAPVDAKQLERQLKALGYIQ